MFKVGDFCVLVLPGSKWNGQEVVVTRGLEVTRMHKISTDKIFIAPAYLVVDGGGYETAQLPHELRLRRPPSWDKWIYDTDHVRGETELTTTEYDGIFWVGIDQARP